MCVTELKLSQGANNHCYVSVHITNFKLLRSEGKGEQSADERDKEVKERGGSVCALAFMKKDLCSCWLVG